MSHKIRNKRFIVALESPYYIRIKWNILYNIKKKRNIIFRTKQHLIMELQNQW
jgi:hypothetical protein